MPRDRHDAIVPDVLLERYRLGELPESEHARIAALVAGHPALTARLRALEQSDNEILGQHSSREMARVVRERARHGSGSRRAMRVVGLVTLGAAAAAIVLAVGLRPGPEDRIKGLTPSLVVYRQTTHGSERLADDVLAHPGDVLRIGYIAAGARYGVIVSVDGRGIVTRHLPKSDDHAAVLSTESPSLLDQAYELDDAPKVERFYFVTAASPFAVSVVTEAAARAASERPGIVPAHLTLPKDLNQFSIAVRKD